VGGATAAANYKIVLTAAEVHYYATIKELGKYPGEFGCVGAGLGGGFLNTQELHVMKSKQAMKTKDKQHWEEGVNEEHDRMLKHKVGEAVPCETIPHGNKIISSTWAMKKKSNDKYCAR
jgi:hypothetical protein